jgi:hypothetical protein
MNACFMWISFGPKPEKEPRVVRAARVVGLVRERGVRVTLGALPPRSFPCAREAARSGRRGIGAIDGHAASAAIRHPPWPLARAGAGSPSGFEIRDRVGSVDQLAGLFLGERPAQIPIKLGSFLGIEGITAVVDRHQLEERSIREVNGFIEDESPVTHVGDEETHHRLGPLIERPRVAFGRGEISWQSTAVHVQGSAGGGSNDLDGAARCAIASSIDRSACSTATARSVDHPRMWAQKLRNAPSSVAKDIAISFGLKP